MCSNRKTIRIDLFIDLKTYMFVIFAESSIFYLAINEFLTNQNSNSKKLIFFLITIIDRFIQDYCFNIYFDAINSTILLIDYIKFIDIASLEKFLTIYIINKQELALLLQT